MSIETVADILGPAPAGLDLSASRTTQDNAIVISLSALSLFTVIIRFIVRLRSPNSKFGPDDWLIASALILQAVLLACSLIAGEWGMGKHIWTTTIPKVVKMKQILLAWLIIYIFELFLIKASILMFYRRIFGMNWTIWACLAIASAWALGSLIALLVCPAPISYFWTEYTAPTSGNFRYNFYNYYLGNAAGNVVSDVLILLVPFPIVWRLKMRVTQKIMVSSVLLLGIFVCAASIVRLHYITGLNTVDLTWAMSNVYVWSDVEPCLGIICACLPAVQPIVRSIMKMEHILLLRSKLRRLSAQAQRSNEIQLRKKEEYVSHHDHRITSLTPVYSPEGKPEGLRTYYDDTPDEEERRLTTMITHIESNESRRLRENLEEFLGSGFIRVQHEVVVNID
ncbi:hypothetical protein N7462_001259 [Penicillium macrosclerotiorum]|uniref:uncharacterized protein n=1 Tax=Penicillium macrosclerotiorum TaxID=303699 RepID=UPI002548A2C3|nr:uncharacterized protein N7462_001259 [Penicillium macrosclerotiorum]KAJ5691836.1 hypothetical protein N7462_001259 [Penicillium macrosclerotiorum]